MSIFKNKNSLRTIEAQIAQKLKNNEARPKFTGSYIKKACIRGVVASKGSRHISQRHFRKFNFLFLICANVCSVTLFSWWMARPKMLCNTKFRQSRI